jgi:hypothetical protein
VHPSLEQLRHLQDLERQAAALRTELEATEQRRHDIEAPVTQARDALEAVLHTIDARQAQRRAGDRDVATLQQRLTKYRQQLMAVTNTREYEAAQHEVATTERELKAREDETIALLFELDDLTAQVEEASAAAARATDAATVSLAGLAEETQRHRLELAALEGSIAALRPQIDAAALALYDRTAKRFPRAAVSELRGDLCVGCNVKIRPMLASEVRRGERIVQCENCTRLLYVAKPVAAPAPAQG